jgi:hypothetical protein
MRSSWQARVDGQVRSPFHAYLLRRRAPRTAKMVCHARLDRDRLSSAAVLLHLAPLGHSSATSVQAIDDSHPTTVDRPRRAAGRKTVTKLSPQPWTPLCAHSLRAGRRRVGHAVRGQAGRARRRRAVGPATGRRCGGHAPIKGELYHSAQSPGTGREGGNVCQAFRASEASGHEWTPGTYLDVVPVCITRWCDGHKRVHAQEDGRNRLG